MEFSNGGSIPLHWLEKRVLNYLIQKGACTIEELSERTGVTLDQARRAVEWLKDKGIVAVDTSSRHLLELGPNGKLAANEGLPERRIVSTLLSSGPISIKELRKLTGMTPDEFGAAIGRAKRLGWINLEEGKVKVQRDALTETPEEELIRLLAERPIEVESLSQDMLEAYKSLSRRPGIIELYEEKMQIVKLVKKPERLQLTEELTLITPELIRKYAMAKFKELDVKEIPKLSQIDIASPVPILNPGRVHPLTRLIEEVRSVLVSMGFEEIRGNIVQPSFWVFDALFTPQDHPARDMQDTLYLQNLRSTISNKVLVNNVRSTHENGWKTGSLGWRYQWSEEEAKRSVLRTHTTALSCRYLAENPDKESRVFSIGRVFRNENLDSTHLFEFTQIEAVISEKNANARVLLGYMSQFYKGLGFEDVKFNPTYFPYTEPSFEPLVYSAELKRWVELGGSGVFRPEVVVPLGVKNNVLAWGFGLERIAMVRFGLDDIRTIYANDLAWLRGVREFP